ncbi:helix-turn-helix transcriptional regulator [Methylotenera versatilis]|uniref:helix-turn-helix transcriptional regulator n=1 Tax=Methylotenera versatilis TaxID=1055487 RepID=UPI000647B6F8|nr:helix-turn-helix domain-containing protein [Methylotenera versatilis]
MQSNLQTTQSEKQQQHLEILDPKTIFVGVDYVAALLGEELSTIYNKSHSGRLPFPVYKPTSSSVRFKYSEIMEWVQNLKPIQSRNNKSKTDASVKRGRGRPPKRLPDSVAGGSL